MKQQDTPPSASPGAASEFVLATIKQQGLSLRLAPLCFVTAGLLTALLLTYWQAPAPRELLWIAAFTAALDFCICAYLIWRQSRWIFWFYLGIPGYIMSLVITKFQPHDGSPLGRAITIVLYLVQWFALFALTLIGLLVCLELFFKMRRRCRRMNYSN